MSQSQEEIRVNIRGIEIGSGMPKICVPVTGRNVQDILSQAESIQLPDVEIVEWRADYADFIEDYSKAEQTLKELRDILGNKILLFTFRTKREGGERELDIERYFALNEMAARTGFVDLIDVELFAKEENMECFVETVHSTGCKVIFSNHDFHKTPEESVILERLCKMEQLGGDILKIAVMPEKPQDVITLLSATCKAANKLQHPVVTMSMSKLGVVSRLTGGIFGSAITFGSAGEASAPGQIPVEQLKLYLQFFS